MENIIIKFVKDFLALYMGITEMYFGPDEEMLYISLKSKGLKVYDAVFVTSLHTYRLGNPEIGDQDHQRVLAVLQMYLHTTHQTMFWYAEPTEQNVNAGPQTFLGEAQLILKSIFRVPGIKTCSMNCVLGQSGQLDPAALKITLDHRTYSYEELEENLSPEILEELISHLQGTISHEGVCRFYF